MPKGTRSVLFALVFFTFMLPFSVHAEEEVHPASLVVEGLVNQDGIIVSCKIFKRAQGYVIKIKNSGELFFYLKSSGFISFKRIDENDATTSSSRRKFIFTPLLGQPGSLLAFYPGTELEFDVLSKEDSNAAMDESFINALSINFSTMIIVHQVPMPEKSEASDELNLKGHSIIVNLKLK